MENTKTAPKLEEDKILVTITGASGSGKTELLKQFVQTGLYKYLVSHTTRQPRPGEVDGKDYWFVTKEAFAKMDSKGEFIQTIDFKGNYYGTHRSEVEAAETSGKIPIVIVEPFGVREFIRFSSSEGYTFKSIYVDADPKLLVDRFVDRLPDDTVMNKETFRYNAKRCASAQQEAATWLEEVLHWLKFYPKRGTLHILTNSGDLYSFHRRGIELANAIAGKVQSSITEETQNASEG